MFSGDGPKMGLPPKLERVLASHAPRPDPGPLAKGHQKTNCWPPPMSSAPPGSAVLAMRWTARAATSTGVTTRAIGPEPARRRTAASRRSRPRRRRCPVPRAAGRSRHEVQGAAGPHLADRVARGFERQPDVAAQGVAELRRVHLEKRSVMGTSCRHHHTVDRSRQQQVNVGDVLDVAAPRGTFLPNEAETPVLLAVCRYRN
jgi:hypothetical protein